MGARTGAGDENRRGEIMREHREEIRKAQEEIRKLEWKA